MTLGKPGNAGYFVHILPYGKMAKTKSYRRFEKFELVKWINFEREVSRSGSFDFIASVNICKTLKNEMFLRGENLEIQKFHGNYFRPFISTSF